MRLNERASSPISSRLVTGSGSVKAPSASWAVAIESRLSERVRCTARKAAVASAAAKLAKSAQNTVFHVCLSSCRASLWVSSSAP